MIISELVTGFQSCQVRGGGFNQDGHLQEVNRGLSPPDMTSQVFTDLVLSLTELFKYFVIVVEISKYAGTSGMHNKSNHRFCTRIN